MNTNGTEHGPCFVICLILPGTRPSAIDTAIYLEHLCPKHIENAGPVLLCQHSLWLSITYELLVEIFFFLGKIIKKDGHSIQGFFFPLSLSLYLSETLRGVW